MSKPLPDHGSRANIGDLVRIYTDAGMDTGVTGVIVEVKEFYSWSMEMWRKVRLNGKLDFVEDYKVRIISKAETNARTGKDLSLIHISEPTRRRGISYAVFCLKKKR